jgi:hypothetical protein
MAFKKKRPHKKLIVAIILVAVLVVAVGALAYASQKPFSPAQLVGVRVGDTFIYSVTGSSSDPVPDVDYPGFYDLNNTQYYKVVVTAIQGSAVTLQTDWVFINGTDIPQQQTIDLSNGLTTDQTGFWGLYPANLKPSDQIYPHMNETVPINGTQTQPYASGARVSNWFTQETTQYLGTDPTQSTMRYLYDQVFFDQKTGIMTNFQDIETFNNPELQLEVIWYLTNSTEWNV